jgi:hypothetical protein
MGDYCAVQFLSKTNIDVPLVYHAKITAVEMTNSLFPVLEQIHDITGIKPLVAYERNAGGVFEMERLAAMNRLNKYQIYKQPNIGRTDPPDQVKFGWTTSSATRPAMLSGLKEAIDQKILRIYDKFTIEELYSFVVVPTATMWKAQAEEGAHDDLVMSLAIAWQMYQDAEAVVGKPNVGELPKFKPADSIIGI